MGADQQISMKNVFIYFIMIYEDGKIESLEASALLFPISLTDVKSQASI